MFAALPVEVVTAILQHLDAESLLRCRGVSKALCSLVSSESVWRARILQRYTYASRDLPSPQDLGCLTYYKLRAAVDKEVEALLVLIADFAHWGIRSTPWHEELVSLGWSALDKLIAMSKEYDQKQETPSTATADEWFAGWTDETIAGCAKSAVGAILRFEAASFLFHACHSIRFPRDPFTEGFALLSALEAFSPLDYRPAELHFIRNYLSTAFIAAQLEREQDEPHPLRTAKVYENESVPAAAVVTFCSMLQLARPGTAVWYFRLTPEDSAFWVCSENFLTERVFIKLTTTKRDNGLTWCLTDHDFASYCRQARISEVTNSADWATSSVVDLVTSFVSDMFSRNDVSDLDLSDRSLELMVLLCSIWTARESYDPVPLEAVFSLVRLIGASMPWDWVILTQILMRLDDCLEDHSRPLHNVLKAKRMAFKRQVAQLRELVGDAYGTGDPHAHGRFWVEHEIMAMMRGA